jgi:hypothetical protein
MATRKNATVRTIRGRDCVSPKRTWNDSWRGCLFAGDEFTWHVAKHFPKLFKAGRFFARWDPDIGRVCGGICFHGSAVFFHDETRDT